MSSAGDTVITATSSAAGSVGSNFSVTLGGLDPIYLDVTTTAAISGPITVCQHYADANSDGIVDGTGVAATDLRMLHGEGAPVLFIDRTVLPVDTVNQQVCASVTSLSPFVLAVDVSNTSTHDSVVRPVAPVKVSIPVGASTVSKTLHLKVVNGDPSESAGHEIRLAVTGSTCPEALLLDSLSQPVGVDFDSRAAGRRTPSSSPAGRSKSAACRSPCAPAISVTERQVACAVYADPHRQHSRNRHGD